MRPHPTAPESKSLKTFFLYAAIVLFFIIISLSVRIFFIIQQNKFDGENNFVLAVAQKDIVKELIIFHPAEHAVTQVKLKGQEVKLPTLGKTLGVIPDAKASVSETVPLTDVTDTMKAIAFHYYSLKTNITIFDAIHLFLISQKASINKQTVKELTVSKNGMRSNKLIATLFTDDKVFSENVSLQIINASGAPGIGKRLERVLTNLGCNVVAITTSRKEEQKSKIQYFGKETHTLNKLKKMLGFPVEKIEKEAIATMVITIGEDSKNSESF